MVAHGGSELSHADSGEYPQITMSETGFNVGPHQRAKPNPQIPLAFAHLFC
jgi:hypothetical protein